MEDFFFFFTRYCGSIKKLLSLRSPTASYSQIRAKGPRVQFNFACKISAQPSGTYSLTFLTFIPFLFFFIPHFFPSPRWTADLLLRAASSWKAQLDSSEHICLSRQIRSCTLRRSTTSWVRSQSSWGTWASSTTAWRASTCLPGSTVRDHERGSCRERCQTED